MSTIDPIQTAFDAVDQVLEPSFVSVVVPCLNEAENIEDCVLSARDTLVAAGLEGEVVVVDNGSDDGSGDLARSAGARVVLESRRGYGRAYLAGFAAARGDRIVMADADRTYDFRDIPRFVEQLEAGADVVIGDRMDHIHPGAMPWLHRYVGNPLLTAILNRFFGTGVRDAHCGMRAVSRDVLPLLDLRSSGMEFASEMVIRAAKADLDIRQVPIEYHPRGGRAKLSTFRDGWRHLRLLFAYSPTHLFLIPGLTMLVLGVLAMLTVLARIDVFGRAWDLHALIAGAVLVAVGTQVAALGVCARAYGRYIMGNRDPWLDRMQKRFRLEHALILGGALCLSGVVLGGVIAGIWIDRGFGALSEERLAVVAATLVIVGVQVFFSSFLISILGLRRGA